LNIEFAVESVLSETVTDWQFSWDEE